PCRPLISTIFPYTTLFRSHLLIINCTPLGTSPNTADCPPIPYQFLTKNHLLFDLIYNPAETEFIKRGKQSGAKTSNGLKMLELRSEEHTSELQSRENLVCR